MARWGEELSENESERGENLTGEGGGTARCLFFSEVLLFDSWPLDLPILTVEWTIRMSIFFQFYSYLNFLVNYPRRNYFLPILPLRSNQNIKRIADKFGFNYSETNIKRISFFGHLNRVYVRGRIVIF